MVKSKLSTAEIIRLYEGGTSVYDISIIAEVSQGAIWKRLRVVGHQVDKNRNSGWKKIKGQEEYLGADGRYWVRNYYPNRKKKSARRYVVVMESYLGYPIPKGFYVHHIDGDCTNDDISNLCLLTIAAHNKIHGGNY